MLMLLTTLFLILIKLILKLSDSRIIKFILFRNPKSFTISDLVYIINIKPSYIRNN